MFSFSCEVLVIFAESVRELGTLAYELGNRHLPLQVTEKGEIVVLPDDPTEALLTKLAPAMKGRADGSSRFPRAADTITTMIARATAAVMDTVTRMQPAMVTATITITVMQPATIMITIIIETVKTGFASVSDVQAARVWPKKTAAER